MIINVKVKETAKNSYYKWTCLKDNYYNIIIDGTTITFVKVKNINNIPLTLIETREKLKFEISMMNQNLLYKRYAHFSTDNENVKLINRINNMLRVFKIEEIFS